MAEKKLTAFEKARQAANVSKEAIKAHDASGEPPKPRPAMTVPGKQAEAMTKGYHQENLELKAELAKWNASLPVRLIDALKIKPSIFANRHAHSLTDSNPEFKSLKAEIAQAGGNVQPIKVRPVKDGDFEFEVVYGHRRLEACRVLGLPVRAMIDDTIQTNEALFWEMERENRERKDLCSYEQGLMYQKAIDNYVFESGRPDSQNRMADKLGISRAKLSILLGIGRLPREIVEAFDSPLQITYRFGLAVNKTGPEEVLRRFLKLELAKANPKKLARELFNIASMSNEEFESQYGDSIDVAKALSDGDEPPSNSPIFAKNGVVLGRVKTVNDRWVFELAEGLSFDKEKLAQLDRFAKKLWST